MSGCAQTIKNNPQNSYNFFHTQIVPLDTSRKNKTFFQVTYLNNAYKNRYKDGEYFIIGFSSNKEDFYKNRYNFYNKNFSVKYNEKIIQPQKIANLKEYGFIPNYNDWSLFYLYYIPKVSKGEFTLEFNYLDQDTETLSFSKSL